MVHCVESSALPTNTAGSGDLWKRKPQQITGCIVCFLYIDLYILYVLPFGVIINNNNSERERSLKTKGGALFSEHSIHSEP